MESNNIIDEEARPVFDLLDDLRLLGIGDDFPIPQIAVIGDQSCGKSSLLEALSGIPFPRGIGLVTRCPTCISMHKTSPSESGWKANISIKSTSPLNANDFNSLDGVGPADSPTELAHRISTLTEQLVQRSSHSFSSEIIHIHVESPDVPDLTIIDLPGIIRTTTAGQAQEAIAEVDALLDYFMQQSKTIILAVIPANQDIATVDVLERAQRVDPMGSRTIGVLTKLDLVDQGAESETLSVVNNIRKPLALGYVMVKNRNQSQLSASVSLEEAILQEENYFSSHEVWKHVPVHQRGIKALSKRLTKVLLYRAQEALPDMKNDIIRRMKDVEVKLKALGDSAAITKEADRSRVCLQLLSKFGQSLRQISEGDYRDAVTQSDPDLRIKFHLDNLFTQGKANLAKSVPEFDSEEYTEYLIKILQELRGRELPGFLSARLLLTAVSCSIEEWRAQLEETFASAVDIYVRAARKLIFIGAKQYPRLCSVVEAVVESTCAKQFSEILKRTNELFETGGLEAISTDRELIVSLNEIRFKRFDDSLREALDGCAEPRPGRGSKEDLKQYVLERMGFEYMQLHSIGYGPSVQIEDAKAALKAYWRMAESRFHSNSAAAIEQVLLLKGSQHIERLLLEIANGGMGDSALGASSRINFDVDDSNSPGGLSADLVQGLSLADLMAEDPAIVTQRATLASTQSKLEIVLRRMDAVPAKLFTMSR